MSAAQTDSTQPWLRPDGTVGYQHRKGACPAKLAPAQGSTSRTAAERYFQVRKLAVFDGYVSCARALGWDLGIDRHEPFIEARVLSTSKIRKESVLGTRGTKADVLIFGAEVAYTRPDGTSYQMPQVFSLIIGRDKKWNFLGTADSVPKQAFGVGSIEQVYYLERGDCFLQFGSRPSAGTLGDNAYAVGVPCSAPGAFRVAATPPVSNRENDPSHNQARQTDAAEQCRAAVSDGQYATFVPAYPVIGSLKNPRVICFTSVSGTAIQSPTTTSR